MGNYIEYCCRLPNDPNYKEGSHDEKKEITNIRVKSKKPKQKITHYPTPRSSRSPNRNSNYSNSPRSQRSPISQSQNKPLIFINNDISVAVNLLSGNNIYDKMIGGEMILKLVSPLNDFTMNNIYEIIKSMYIIIKKLIVKDEYVKLHEKLSENIGNAIGYDNIDFSDMGEGDMFIAIKNEMIDIVCDLVEMYHFVKFTIAGGREPYDNYLWSNVDDIDKYIEGLIIKAKESIENVKSSVMTIGKGNEIEINTNKINV